MNLTIEIRAKPERFQELYQTMHALLPTMRREDGCRESRIYRDADDGDVFFLWMSWDDAAKFEKYMRSMSGSALLGAFDTLSKGVRVRVGADDSWRGIEVLRRLPAAAHLKAT
ncbi:MAG: antibiotic biosynthesis monooxygenase [Syntrophaceae bacterium]